jgi:hypothetical protein
LNWERWRISKNGCPPRPQSTEKMKETRSQIEQMLELDLIEPSKSPYYSHLHLVRKRTGKWWFVSTSAQSTICAVISGGQFRTSRKRLNGKTRRKRKYSRSLIWLRATFRCFRPDYLRRNIVHLPWWVYRWKCIPMGWKSAVADCQQQLAGVLSGLLYKECDLYMDDILPFADSKEEMLQRLHCLFTRFREYNATLNPKKCAIGMDRLECILLELS